MTEQVIPVPEIMRQLIQHQNDGLNRLQQEYLNDLGNANAELMKILNLDPDEGWKLDLTRMVYVRTIGESIDEPTP